MNTETPIKSIQGPCGNTVYQSLSPIIDSNIKSSIPYVPEEQLVMEERFSNIDGYFGTVRLNTNYNRKVKEM